MFERKETIIKNKKYLISHEYVRKVFESNNSQRNIKFKDNNSDFKKVETIQKINISNDHPLVLFHKPNQNNMHKYENQIKKDLIDNKGYLNDGGYKKKLLRFYSSHNTDQNQSKNIFRSSYSQHKNRSKHNDNHNIFNSKRTSLSTALNKRTIQKDYSNSIKIKNKRINTKNNKEEKNKINKLFNSVNIKDIKHRDSLIKQLTDKNNIVKNLFRSANLDMGKNNAYHDYQKKKDYLEHNNICYDDSEIKENKNEINSLTNIKKKRNNKSYKGLKDIKDIKMNDKIIYTNDKDKNLIYNNKKKRYKNIVDQFEFLQKIKKEIKILRKSKEKDQLSNKN